MLYSFVDRKSYLQYSQFRKVGLQENEYIILNVLYTAELTYGH